jgi:hypothetical protein
MGAGSARDAWHAGIGAQLGGGTVRVERAADKARAAALRSAGGSQ